MARAMRKGASRAFGARAHGKKLAQARLLVCSQSLRILGSVGSAGSKGGNRRLMRCPNHYHFPDGSNISDRFGANSQN